MRSRIWAGALAVMVVAAGPLVARANGVIHVGSLGADDEVFWNGGYVGFDPLWSAPFVSPNPALDRCGIDGHPCFTYTLTTTEATARLRIGLDTPMRDDGFEVSITPPNGAPATMSNGNRYSMEAFIAAPPVGTYTITVVPYSADHAQFRMRAKLESQIPSIAPGDGAVLPNLQVTRLWEFGFAAPANPGNGLFPPDDVNPPLDVAGYHPVSCTVDEQLGYDGGPIAVGDGEQAKRCLRYSFGLANVGEGIFDVRFTGDRSGAPASMFQCLQQRDGSPPVSSAAGTGSYHQTHGHYHYDDIIHHTIFRVTDAEAGTLVAAGAGSKIGYSPADQGMPHWRLFNQSAPGARIADCTGASANRVGMSPGWGDAYRYQRPGNFVEFAGNGDGLYVVTTTADPLGLVQESDEGDNTSYAYLRIIGDEIHVLETGLGSSPWNSDGTFEQ